MTKTKTSIVGCIIMTAMIVGAANARTITGSTSDNGRPTWYSIVRTLGPDSKGFVLLVVAVEIEHFNRTDILAIAAELNSVHATTPRLKAGFFEPKVAQLVAGMRMEPATEYAEQRGLYVLDRPAGKERVEYRINNDPSNRIVVDLSARRSQKRG